jgi:ectoine hydroxylase-related dioxygenase (phytanoyl-CoA dioxygenase family)
MNYLNKFFEFEGYLKLDKYFAESDFDGFDNALENISSSGGVDIYHDRLGNLRRLEQFTFKHNFFTQLNEKIKSLLFEVTGTEYNLFKDKINFKPPGGEGFYAHYDGVFEFDDGLSLRKGWYEYADKFVNVLIALNNFTVENGALEVASVHEGSFDVLLQNTKQDGSPDLIDNVISKSEFHPIIMDKGGVLIFSNLCPHRSYANKSSNPRGSIYLTYNEKKYGNNYERYFIDKKNSKNPFKALTGEIK